MKGVIQAICFTVLLGCHPSGSVEESSETVSVGAAALLPDSTEDDVSALLVGDTGTITIECILPVATMPEFPGGQEKLAAFLARTLQMPREAESKKITGTVFVQFTITPAGAVQDAQVLKGIGYGCDEEALRLTKIMPKWKPGEQSGRPVPVRYSLPIRFASK
jgi:TonB family protein